MCVALAHHHRARGGWGEAGGGEEGGMGGGAWVWGGAVVCAWRPSVRCHHLDAILVAEGVAVLRVSPLAGTSRP